MFVKSARPERSSFTVWASARPPRPRRRVLSVTLTSSGVPAPGRGRELAFPVYIPAPPAGGGAERQRREGLRGRQPSPCRVRPGRARQLLPHPPSSLLRMRLHAGPFPLNLSLRCRNGACVVVDFAALRRVELAGYFPTALGHEPRLDCRWCLGESHLPRCGCLFILLSTWPERLTGLPQGWVRTLPALVPTPRCPSAKFHVS